MGTASLQFIAFGLSVALISNLHRSVAWRQWVLLLASIGFLGFFSLDPRALIPLAGFLAFGYMTVSLIRTRAKWVFAPAVLIGIGAFVWLKKYAFVPSELLLEHPYLTLGLSYIFFRVLHLIIDSRNDDIPEKVSIVSYLNYTLNFTTLVSGPIQPYQDFAKSQLSREPLPLTLVTASRALERIIVGFYKVNVLSLFLSMIQTNAITALASGGRGTERVFTAFVIVGVYPLYLYCNFSGYIDIVIGIGRLLRIDLPENFDRPFSSPSFLIFWNRWHITLSTWLKTYVYNPLLIVCMGRWQSAAAAPYLAVFAFFVTFFLIGVWHGQTSEFLFYGILLGLGVSVNKLHQVLSIKWLGRKRYNSFAGHWLYVTIARGVTFTWFSFSLLWFWSNWHQLHMMADSLSQLEMLGTWGLLLVGSSVMFGLWEVLRDWSYSFRFENRPFVASRYVRTAWCTACVVLAIVTIEILNAPAPDIVYKAF